MALFHNRNYSARFEKEEMALFHNRVKEIRSMVMAEEFRRLLECISPFEIEKKGLSNLKALINIQLETLDTWSDWKTKEDLFKIATTKAEETNDLFKMVTTKAEKTNVLRQQVHELKEIFEKSRDEIKLCKYREASNIADACCQVLRFILAAIDEWLEWQLFIVLLAVLLLGNNEDCKGLVRPERGTISCITVYLLGNDGAHSYNGNGIRFTKPIKYVRLTDEELVDQRGHAEPPSDVLLGQPTDREQATITRDVLLRLPTDREQTTITKDVLLRQPTDVELAKIAPKIGEEYVLLALLLGITIAELDHIREDNSTAVRRIFYMLIKWRKNDGSNATIEKLADKLEELGRNADIVYSSLDEA